MIHLFGQHSDEWNFLLVTGCHGFQFQQLLFHFSKVAEQTFLRNIIHGFFPQPPEKTGSVLLFSGEDDPGKVLKARLTAAGADMSRVMVVTSDAYFARTGSPLCIPDTSFAKYVGKAAPALVIIDPLQSTRAKASLVWYH